MISESERKLREAIRDVATKRKGCEFGRVVGDALLDLEREVSAVRDEIRMVRGLLMTTVVFGALMALCRALGWM